MDMMMTSRESRHQYGFRIPVLQQHLQYVKPTDSFEFQVVGLLRIPSSFPRYDCLFVTCISITCEHFFFGGNNQDLLRRHITNQPYFPPSILDDFTEKIMHKLQRLFALDTGVYTGFSEPPDSEAQEFCLSLQLLVEERNDAVAVVEESMQHVVEESMQHVRMIPASKEAIHSLRTYKLPRQCPICMENFHDHEQDEHDDVEFTPMPCGHGFHHYCILKWLESSHMCPICRYTLPTANN